MATKSTKYVMDVYYPESRKDVWVSFESTTPFMAVGKGEVIDPSVWSASRSPIRVLRVSEVHHSISQTDEQIEHKVELFTEEAMVFEAPGEE